VPSDLAGIIEAFKKTFKTSAAAAGAADPTATDAEELGAAASNKTLATE
jgi:hypothetical protein